MKVTIKCSAGPTFDVEIEGTHTVLEVKRMCVEKSGIVLEAQRLIYKGQVLKDGNTMETYGLVDGHTIHLVKGAVAGATGSPTASQAAATSSTTGAQQPSPAAGSSPSSAAASGTAAAAGGGQQAPNPFAAMGGMGGMGGMFGAMGAGGGGMPSMQEMQAQLMANPEMMQSIMNSPAMQGIMSNPDILRGIIQSNPQLRELTERNPEIGHVLNDPAILRQTMEVARNPELMREMMRTSDRAMTNIESHPEGFNMLRRMYHTVQEPMMDATTGAGQTEGDLAANPFAALMPGRTGSAGSGTTGTAAAPSSGAPPNPWAPPAAQTGAPSAAPAAAGGNAAAGLGGGLAGLGGLGALGGMGGGNMQAMMQDPAMLQMGMQLLRDNPGLVQNVMGNPALMQQVVGANPALAGHPLLGNPEVMRAMADPANIQAMLQLRQAMEQLQRSGLLALVMPGAEGFMPPNTGDVGGPYGGGNNPFAQLFSGGPAPSSSAPAVPPEERFRSQLEKLAELGFSDRPACIRALERSGGNVERAVEFLLTSM